MYCAARAAARSGGLKSLGEGRNALGLGLLTDGFQFFSRRSAMSLFSSWGAAAASASGKSVVSDMGAKGPRGAKGEQEKNEPKRAILNLFCARCWLAALGLIFRAQAGFARAYRHERTAVLAVQHRVTIFKIACTAYC